VRILNDQLEQDLDAGRPIALSIGSGSERESGRYTLDLREMPGIDVVADLNQPLSALPDKCVSSVQAHHVLEHVRQLDGLMDELHRVLTPDGVIQVIVPHWANPLGHSDPTHVRLFGLYSFGYFVPIEDQPLDRKVPVYRSDHLFRIRSLSFGFVANHRLGRTIERAVNASPRRMEFFERNLTRFYWPYHIQAELSPI